MESALEFKNFRDLESLVGEDYINGRKNLSQAILLNTAGVIIKNSKIIGNEPFNNFFMAKKSNLERDKKGIFNFLISIKESSLAYLDRLVPSSVYIFDDDEYSLYSTAAELNTGYIKYDWQKKDLKEEEIEMLSNMTGKSKDKYENLIKYLDAIRDYNLLLYNIKSSAKYLYDPEKEAPLKLYVLESRFLPNGKDLLNLEKAEKASVYKGLENAQLFINDKSGVYSLENANYPEFVKHDERDSKYGIIINLIKKRDNGIIYG